MQAVAHGAFDGDPLDLMKAVRVVDGSTERFAEPFFVSNIGERGQLKVLNGVESHFASGFCEVQQVVAGGQDRFCSVSHR